MTVLTNFREKRIAKQRNFEKKLIQELTVRQIRDQIHAKLAICLPPQKSLDVHIETRCIDIALEVFLLGASYSKLGYYGESMEKIKERTMGFENTFIDEIYSIIRLYCLISEEMSIQQLQIGCKEFIHFWFNQGFEKGKRRYQLRLVK